MARTESIVQSFFIFHQGVNQGLAAYWSSSAREVNIPAMSSKSCGFFAFFFFFPRLVTSFTERFDGFAPGCCFQQIGAGIFDAFVDASEVAGRVAGRGCVW